MSFREAISAIPYTPTTAKATGILAPLIRAIGHIMYVAGALAEPGYTLSDEEVHTELRDAAAHLSDTRAAVEAAPLSTTFRSYAVAFIEAVGFADAEWPDWPDDERGPNLKDLADRAASLGTLMDTEFAGVTGSNPGRTL